jgi:NADH-quinone oxidoreductase subunit L
MNASYVIIGLPLLGAILILVGGRKLGDPLSGWLATLCAAGAFASTVVVWAITLGRHAGVSGPGARSTDKEIFNWISVAGLHVNFALQLDPLSITMALFVTGVGTLIHLYSIGYMKGDPSYPRFFFLLNLFLFSMLVLVLADSYLFSFLGWEGVGFCSYGLVGFWFDRETAAVAAKKAFVTNRVGDFGFMIALFLMFDHFKSFNYSVVLGGLSQGRPGAIAGVTATGLGMMLFLGAAGKSAQIPLYMWLPDAMEGPTPVSALIHAATMVTAGVYLVARSAPILHYSHSSQVLIACIGAATALFAATIACTQNDIKRVLAYSTLSQLGYMFLAEGSGGYVDGLFHMITHAFFKALLFLAAGSVIHAMHDEQDMKKMGALRRYLPITFPTFIIGYLALSGIFPFAGFWSKDDTLDAAWHMNKGLWVVGAVTAVLTAYYMSRQVALVWGGKARWSEPRPEATSSATTSPATTSPATTSPATTSDDSGSTTASSEPGQVDEAQGHGHGHGDHDGLPHESSPVMTIPLILLSVGALLGGLINFPFFHWNFLERWLAPMFPAAIDPSIHVGTTTKVVLSLVVLAGCLIALVVGLGIWKTSEHPDLEPALITHGWYVDEALAATVSGPVTAGANGLAFMVDAGLVDGTVNGVAHATTLAGRQLRRLQTGYVRNYAIGLAAGTAVLLCYVAARIGS